MDLGPISLEGARVRLEPISRTHEARLWDAAKDHLEDIFRWIPYAMRSPEDFHAVMDRALDEQQLGLSVVFVTLDRRSGRVIGSTRFMNIDQVNQNRNRFHLDRSFLAKNRDQHRSKVLDAASCLRGLGVPSG